MPYKNGKMEIMQLHLEYAISSRSDKPMSKKKTEAQFLHKI